MRNDKKCQRCGSFGGYGCYECTPDHAQSELQAAVAAAYDAAFRAAFRACKSAEAGYVDENSRLAQRIENELRLYVSEAIKSLTPDDAQAALHRVKREARNEGRREAVAAASNTAHDGNFYRPHINKVTSAILGLMEDTDDDE